MYQLFETVNKTLYTNGLIIKQNFSVCAVGVSLNECNKYCNSKCLEYEPKYDDQIDGEETKKIQPANFTYIMTATNDYNLNRSGFHPMPRYYCPNSSIKNPPHAGVHTESSGTIECTSKVQWAEYKLKGISTLSLTCPDSVDCTTVTYKD